MQPDRGIGKDAEITTASTPLTDRMLKLTWGYFNVKPQQTVTTMPRLATTRKVELCIEESAVVHADWG
jgi:hypothetical protein